MPPRLVPASLGQAAAAIPGILPGQAGDYGMSHGEGGEGRTCPSLSDDKWGKTPFKGEKKP